MSSPSIANYSTTAVRIDATISPALPGANYAGYMQGATGSPGQRIYIGAELG
jgi:hypothetical protein